MTDVVELEYTGGLARVTLNRPDAANAIDLAVGQRLVDVALELRARADLRAVLLTGAGARFCAGGDVRSFADSDDLPRHLRALTTPLHAAISILSGLDAPIVAAVHGSVAGAGLGLMCASDIVIAAESTKFTMAYTGIGLTPDGSTTWFIPRIVGLRRATELALTNRVFTAAEAQSYGLVTDVVADDAAIATATALAEKLGAGPTLAYGSAKRLMLRSMTSTLESQMAAESDAICAAASTEDGRGAIAAFIAKQKPTFAGR